MGVVVPGMPAVTGRKLGLQWAFKWRSVAQVSLSYTDEMPPLYEDLGPLRPRPRRQRVDEPVKEEPAQPSGVYKPRGPPAAARKWKVGSDSPSNEGVQNRILCIDRYRDCVAQTMRVIGPPRTWLR